MTADGAEHERRGQGPAASPAVRPGEGALHQGEPAAAAPVGPRQFPGETNGPKGPEPTRFGDWEKGGRCTDF